jgi:hypothetical protein
MSCSSLLFRRPDPFRGSPSSYSSARSLAQYPSGWASQPGRAAGSVRRHRSQLIPESDEILRAIRKHAVETLVLAAVYARYSLNLAATNPLVWALVMNLMAAVVAYGGYVLRPPSA